MRFMAHSIVLQSLMAVAASASTLIDFNMSGRQASEVLETGWNGWTISGATSADTALNGVTFTVSRYGSVGTSIKSNWYKAGIQSPSYARLICDGIYVDSGTAGGAIQLTLSGLAAGTHTLLTYHNAVDGSIWAPINVSVDGVLKVSGLQPTSRALVTDSSAYSFVTFTATAGKTVTVIYAPVNSSSSVRDVIINAIALDVANPKGQAGIIAPTDRDWHVNADAGSTTLSWTAAASATGHQVYFGTDSAAVASATTASAAYMGAQTATTRAVSGLSSLKTYWWRVDETSASGTVKGNLWSFSPRHLAFPGAEGYGRFARGGRGGKVVHVTSLADDSSAGTLRRLVGDSSLGPRTIVFDIGGTITLKSRLTLASNFVTVAGQTAPGQGIQIVAAPFGLSGVHDDIMRFIKIRVGYGTTYDGMGGQGSDHSIFDHCTVNWSSDEAFSSRNGKHITLQRTILAECLNYADHLNSSGVIKEAHGYAASIGGDTASFHHNLLANNEGRNWSMACGLDGNGYFWGALDIFNNVVYNWGGRTTDGGCHLVNFVGNYYKTGPASTIYTALQAQYDSFPGTQQYYCQGNLVSGHLDDTAAVRNGCINDGNPNPWVSSRFFPSYATVQTAHDAYKDVLSDVGASMPALDTHDLRTIRETADSTVWGKGSISGKFGLPDRETDVGGFMTFTTVSRAANFDTDGDGLPDWYENLTGTNPNSGAGDFSDASADANGDGYTGLDDYLEWMATPHAETKTGTAVTFNLAELFRGYQKTTPSYTLGKNSAFTASIKDSILTVTPSTAGLAYLDVTVTDKEKATKTRRVGICATGSTTGFASLMPRTFTWTVRRGGISLTTDATGSFLLMAAGAASAASLPAFPGALGYANSVTGGRGGTVVHVTNLNDTGAGSFRKAVSSANRIVVFDVGGTVTLKTAVSLSSNLTIAGQTAPGGGITFIGGELSCAKKSNIIMRHVRVRPGSLTASSTDDALSLYNARDVILDHCSFEFAPWNNIDGVSSDWKTSPVTNITFQNCLIADPIGQQFGAHCESVASNWAWYGNAFVNSHNRNPLAKTNTVFINNVEYNYQAAYTTHTSTGFKHDIVNNYFITGPSTSTDNTWFQIDKNQLIHYAGNLKDSDKDGVLDSAITAPYWYQGTGTVLSSPWSPLTSSGPLYSATTAFRLVTSQSGALPRDQLDSLIWSQVNSLGKQGTIYTSQTATGLGNSGYGTTATGTRAADRDNDGMPDYWEAAMGSDSTKNDAMTIGRSGYALIEDYINWLAGPHVQTFSGSAVKFDLRDFTSGFSAVSPNYTVTSGIKGTAALQADGHTVLFTPTASATGLDTVKYTVKGTDGTSFTGSVAVLLKPAAGRTTSLSGTAAAGTATVQVSWFSADGRLLVTEARSVDLGSPHLAPPAGLHGMLFARFQANGTAPRTMRFANF